MRYWTIQLPQGFFNLEPTISAVLERLDFITVHGSDSNRQATNETRRSPDRGGAVSPTT